MELAVRATLSQARLAALIDTRLTELPVFLAYGPASSSGAMILEYLAADLVARVRATAVPAVLTHATLSFGLEEAANGALRLKSGADEPGLEDRVLGDELRAAAALVAEWCG